jgi:hypothetical protein
VGRGGLIANIDLPFGAPSPKIRTAILASRDRVGTRGLADLMWCRARLPTLATDRRAQRDNLPPASVHGRSS